MLELEFGGEPGGVETDPASDRLERVGPYELIEELRRGGMGRVFVARQIELGRIVALKTVTVGAGARPELEMRFLREAQTIARLRHPNIVAVHDFGRAAGCVYFSMDFIEDGDLAARLRREPMGVAAGAELLRKVAAALEHAHQQGVLHRDLKPSNILLDGEEPLLADFGLATEVGAGGDLTNATSILGTPHYLAPEAMRGGSAALSVASDIYALGVVLFELLTGRTPFAGATPAELPALVAETEPPAPHLLAPALPGDLETICLKCLERDPARRYATAGMLAEDLRRFLAGERVLAQPPNTWYVFRKFARRHRVFLAASSVVAVVLIAATAVSAWQAVRATRAEKQAAAEAASSREVTRFLQDDLLAQAAPDAQPNRDLPLRTALDRAANKIGTRFHDQPLVAASLEAVLGATYGSLGEFASAQHHFEEAIALRQRTLGRVDTDTLALMAQLADMLSYEGKNAQALPLMARTLEAMQSEMGPEAPATVQAMSDSVTILHGAGKFADAEAMALKALAISRRVFGPNSSLTRDTLSNLASVYFAEEKLADAERLNVEALAQQEQALGREHPSTLVAMSNLASVYWAEGKFADSEKENLQILEIRRRVLGPEHPDTLRSMHNLATTYAEEGRLPEAAALEREALDLRGRILGADHRDTLSSMNALATDELKQGKLAEAEALLVPGRERCRRVLGAENYLTLNVSSRLAALYQREGKLVQAEAVARDNLAVYERVAGAASWHTVQMRDMLGAILSGEGRYPEAETQLLGAYAAMTQRTAKIPASEEISPRLTAGKLVALYRAWGKAAAAEVWQARAK